MNNALAEELLKTFSGFKRLLVRFPNGGELSPGEFFLLRGISTLSSGCGCGRNDREDIHVSRLRDHMDTSLPAVSQLLGALEKKRLILRKVSAGDRRKITVSLTPEGEALIQKSMQSFSSGLEELVARLGEDDARTFINICARITAILEELHHLRGNETL